MLCRQCLYKVNTVVYIFSRMVCAVEHIRKSRQREIKLSVIADKVDAVL